MLLNINACVRQCAIIFWDYCLIYLSKRVHFAIFLNLFSGLECFTLDMFKNTGFTLNMLKTLECYISFKHFRMPRFLSTWRRVLGWHVFFQYAQKWKNLVHKNSKTLCFLSTYARIWVHECCVLFKYAKKEMLCTRILKHCVFFQKEQEYLDFPNCRAKENYSLWF